jgi:hypothetical protein
MSPTIKISFYLSFFQTKIIFHLCFDVDGTISKQVDEIGCFLVVNPHRILHKNGGQTDTDSKVATAAKGINNGDGFGRWRRPWEIWEGQQEAYKNEEEQDQDNDKDDNVNVDNDHQASGYRKEGSGGQG